MLELFWIVAAPLSWAIAALVFRRFRKGTQGFAERNLLKTRLPPWVATLEGIVWVAFYLAGSLGLLFLFMRLHGLLHPTVPPRGVSELATVLICTGSFVAPLAPSMLMANLASWLIPPARRANLTAMAGLPTTSFGNASRGLALMGAVIVPLALGQAILGVVEPWG